MSFFFNYLLGNVGDLIGISVKFPFDVPPCYRPGSPCFFAPDPGRCIYEVWRPRTKLVHDRSYHKLTFPLKVDREIGGGCPSRSALFDRSVACSFTVSNASSAPIASAALLVVWCGVEEVPV